MVNDFNGFDKGVIGKKLPSDSTLNNMKKAELIKLLHIAEHNHSTLALFYKNACDNSKCNRCPLGMNYNKALDDVENEFLMCDKVHYNLQDILCVINKLKAGASYGNG